MKTKILSGRDLASFIKERQAHQVAGMDIGPHLLIIRDSDNPVIAKYVNLKIKYGKDIGVEVEDICANDNNKIQEEITTDRHRDYGSCRGTIGGHHALWDQTLRTRRGMARIGA